MHRAENKTLGLVGQTEIFDRPSVQFDTITICGVTIVENCMENGLGPSTIFSSG